MKDQILSDAEPAMTDTQGARLLLSHTESEQKKNQEAQEFDEHPDNRKTETRSAQSIRTSELSYRRLFEAARDGILILDVGTGCITDVNPYLFKLLGFSRAEMIGKTVGELSPFKDIEANQVMLERLQAKGYVHYDNLPLETKDGLKIAVEFVSNVYQAGDKKVIQCNVRDITERRKLEAMLVESQKMEALGQLASGIAHDFNNMLSVIMGYSELLKFGLVEESAMQEHNRQIWLAAERAAQLTAQLLVFSRKQVVQPVELDFNFVVREVEDMLRRMVDEKIELKIDLDQDAGHVLADAGYMGQVLMNLVVNARDAMPTGGRVTIATRRVTLDKKYAEGHLDVMPGEYVLLSVSDTGCGMTEAVKARVFEAFYTTKDAGKGTGLGLATCQTIVKQSNGHITLESEVGKGTTFKIYFPRITPGAATESRSSLAMPLPRGTESILVVEDETAVRNLASTVLQAHGYKVVLAANGAEGLRAAHSHAGAPFQLVITDVIMPVMGGQAMAEWLKTTDPELKILFTSGYIHEAIERSGVLEKGVDFLPKPYSPATLCHKVREMLDSPPAGAQP